MSANKEFDSNQKPVTIRVIGLIVSVFSGFVIFSNGMGALAFTLGGFQREQRRQSENIELH